MQGFPLQMTHPQFAPAVTSQGDAREDVHGRPARYPPVWVESPEQEEEQRARGYLRVGEAAKMVDGYHEYPKMMHHPQCEPAVPAQTSANLVDGRLMPFTIPAKPGKFPDQIARNAREEAAWQAKGYTAAGDEDPIAFGRAVAAPGYGDEDVVEYPRFNADTGEIEEDPDAPPPPDFRNYPKYLVMEGWPDVIVKSAQEEHALMAKRGMPVEARGSTKNEPVKRSEPTKAYESDPQYQAFLAWQRAQDAEKALAEAQAEEGGQPDSMDALREQAGTLGIDVDKRWGRDRLQREIDKKLAA